jgi:hypothetical protein
MVAAAEGCWAPLTARPEVGMYVNAQFDDEAEPYWEKGLVVRLDESKGQLMVVYDGGDVGWADYPDAGFELVPGRPLKAAALKLALEKGSRPLYIQVCANYVVHTLKFLSVFRV